MTLARELVLGADKRRAQWLSITYSRTLGECGREESMQDHRITLGNHFVDCLKRLEGIMKYGFNTGCLFSAELDII